MKKSMNAELFIDRTVARHIGETWIWVVTNEGDQRDGTCWLEERAYLAKKCYLDLKRCGNERLSVKLSQNCNEIKVEQYCHSFIRISKWENSLNTHYSIKERIFVFQCNSIIFLESAWHLTLGGSNGTFVELHNWKTGVQCYIEPLPQVNFL